MIELQAFRKNSFRHQCDPRW